MGLTAPLRARLQVMSPTDGTTCSEIERVSDLLALLNRTTHNAYPVTVDGGALVGCAAAASLPHNPALRHHRSSPAGAGGAS